MRYVKVIHIIEYSGPEDQVYSLIDKSTYIEGCWKNKDVIIEATVNNMTDIALSKIKCT